MADNVTIPATGSGSATPVIATDDVGGAHYQRVKPDFGGDGVSQAPDTNSGVKSAGTQRVVLATDQPQLTNALKVDGSAVTQPVSVASVPSHPVTNAGTFAVQAASAGDVAHDAADSGNPVKIGMKAVSAFISSLTTGRRTNAYSDLLGRLLVAHKPAEAQKSFHSAFTTTQTGTAVWTPAGGKRIVVTSIEVTAGGSTAGTAMFWFGASGDTTYSIGTDQPLAHFALDPSISKKNVYPIVFSDPVACLNADYILCITTNGNITCDVVVHGYEIT